MCAGSRFTGCKLFPIYLVPITPRHYYRASFSSSSTFVFGPTSQSPFVHTMIRATGGKKAVALSKPSLFQSSLKWGQGEGGAMTVLSLSLWSGVAFRPRHACVPCVHEPIDGVREREEGARERFKSMSPVRRTQKQKRTRARTQEGNKTTQAKGLSTRSFVSSCFFSFPESYLSAAPPHWQPAPS